MTLLQQPLVRKNSLLPPEAQERFAQLERYRVAFVEEMETCLECEKTSSDMLDALGTEGITLEGLRRLFARPQKGNP